jgi:FkbM family methyltransferase
VGSVADSRGIIAWYRRHRLRAGKMVVGLPTVRSKIKWIVRSALFPFATIPCTVTARDGSRFHLDQDGLDDVVIADTYGMYWPLYFPLTPKEFPAGGLILDVGAHHGIFSVAAIRHYPNARLIAVEPDPTGAKMLRANVALNGYLDRAEIVDAAIAAKEGSALLARSLEGSWANRLVDDEEEDEPVVHVRSVRLESILRGRKPFLVKCNAEGGEFEMIPQLLGGGLRPAFISLFVHPDAGSESRLLDEIRGAGYGVKDMFGTPDHPRYLCTLKV